jgi:hypothetical protein
MRVKVARSQSEVQPGIGRYERIGCSALIRFANLDLRHRLRLRKSVDMARAGLGAKRPEPDRAAGGDVVRRTMAYGLMHS